MPTESSLPAALPSPSQTVEDGAKQRQGVPVQHAADGYGPVPEPRHLLHVEVLVVYNAEHHAAARSAEIDGDMVRGGRHLTRVGSGHVTVDCEHEPRTAVSAQVPGVFTI